MGWLVVFYYTRSGLAFRIRASLLVGMPGSEIETLDKLLLEAAAMAFENAYAPYSRFPVGAALEDETGQIWQGANVEVASFGATSCAERSALFAAASAGQRRFKRVLILTEAQTPTAPCGLCRQALAEFSPDLEVISRTVSGQEKRWRLSDLLPDHFGPADLGQ